MENMHIEISLMEKPLN